MKNTKEMMENTKEIMPKNQEFNFSRVPSWYVLCTNNDCQLKEKCLRFLVGKNAPESVELATCVMPKMLKNGECRWFNEIKVEVWAAGFTHLFDKVLKKDSSAMRKTITSYLHGTKFYYQYMRGEKALSPEQQLWIKNYVKSLGYEWEVEFDTYFEDYLYRHQPLQSE